MGECLEYDSNGNRIKRNVDDEQTSYEYNDENRLTKVTSLERVSEFGYDGLGREVKQSDTTELGTSETTSTWSGDSVVQQTTKTEALSTAPFQAGPNTKQLTSKGGDSGDVTTLVRDSFGDVALQSKAGEASWSLLDNLGSTAAQAVGGQVTDLASYSAWGVQMFESSGWDAVTGFTGERSDPGYGLNNYFSRTYDPSTGVWLSQDSWRGLLEQPQSLARYGYVTNNPASLVDEMGYRSGSVNTCYVRGYRADCKTPTGQPFTGSAPAMFHNPATAPRGWVYCAVNGRVAQCSMLSPVPTPAPKPQTDRGPYVGYPPTAPSPKAPNANHEFVPDRHCAGSGKFRRCSSRWGTGIDLPLDMLNHFYNGNGAEYVINWKYFQYDEAFYEFAYQIPVGQERPHNPGPENNWMFMAIGTYSVTRVSQNCFSIYDHYDFYPDKPSNYPYVLINYQEQLGHAKSYAATSWGCF